MFCPDCKSYNAAQNVRFCYKDGLPLVQADCPCGNRDLAPSQKFCELCGLDVQELLKGNVDSPIPSKGVAHVAA